MAIDTGNAKPAPGATVSSKVPTFFGGSSLILSGVLVALIAIAAYAIYNSWDAMVPATFGTDATTQTEGQVAPKTNAQ